MLEVGLELGFYVIGRPAKAFWTHKRVVAPWLFREATSPPGTFSAEKPVAEAFERSPEWRQQLHFAADLMLRVLSRAPGVERIVNIRFENPMYGPVLAEADTREFGGPDLVSACARALLGNKVDGGTVVVNRDSRFDFNCDCRGQVDVFLHLPEENWWLSTLREDVDAAARAHNVIPKCVF